jgi:predicted GNAT superfamily acetyltransferase
VSTDIAAEAGADTDAGETRAPADPVERRRPAPRTGHRTAAGLPTEVLAEAADTAERAARAAGVSLVELRSMAEMTEACRLLDRVWRPGPGNPLMAPNLLKVLSFCGSYVVAAVRDARMVGVCVGLLADFGLHSHIAGVEDGLRGGGLGRAVKLHQRSWALARGIETITWTFDPLISRNAYFNLTKLGAVAAEYLTDYYGPMHDGLNAGAPSDRLLVRWHLADPAVGRALAGGVVPDVTGAEILLEADPAGRPIRGRARHHGRTGGRHLIAVPRDAEAMRMADPALAAEWRLALRDVLGEAMAAGRIVTGFTRDGRYVIEQNPDRSEESST